MDNDNITESIVPDGNYSRRAANTAAAIASELWAGLHDLAAMAESLHQVVEGLGPDLVDQRRMLDAAGDPPLPSQAGSTLFGALVDEEAQRETDQENGQPARYVQTGTVTRLVI